MATERHYTHSIVSYASLDEIRRLLDQAKAWAYICHDKDKNEDGKPRDTHYHIVATFNNKKTFKWVCNQVVSTQNTFSEAVKGEIGDVIDYFTHKGFTDKFQYASEDIVYSDKAYWERRIGNCDTSQEDKNEAFVDDLLAVNFSVEAMGRKYGRDFIKNYRSYQAYRDRCLWERQRQALRESDEFKDFETAKKVQYFKLTEEGELIPVFEDYLFRGRE